MNETEEVWYASTITKGAELKYRVLRVGGTFIVHKVEKLSIPRFIPFLKPNVELLHVYMANFDSLEAAEKFIKAYEADDLESIIPNL